ncbi:hypothetical protein D3C87_324800 [compost metagenome]
MYKIVRKFYNSTGDLESGNFYKMFQHPFTPLTLEEAMIVKPKLTNSAGCSWNWIDVIEMIDAKE